MSTTVVVIALAAVVVGALLKSISGLGLPLVAIPAITAAADIETAVAVTALPNLALNAALAWSERSSWGETRDLPVLGAAGFVGAIAGTLILVSVPDEPLIVLLVVVVAVYVATYFAKPDFSVSADRSRRLAPAVGTVAGALQGAVGISGPVVASWIHSYRLPRSAHILSVTTLFAIAGVAQLPTLVLSDEMDGRWTVALLACIPALATIPVGGRLRNALSSEGFDRVVVATLAVSVMALAAETFI